MRSIGVPADREALRRAIEESGRTTSYRVCVALETGAVDWAERNDAEWGFVLVLGKVDEVVRIVAVFGNVLDPLVNFAENYLGLTISSSLPRTTPMGRIARREKSGGPRKNA